MYKTKLHLEQILVEYVLKIARPMAPPGRSIRPHSFLAMSERKNSGQKVRLFFASACFETPATSFSSAATSFSAAGSPVAGAHLS
jgi:hypothetical protein